MRCSGSRVQYVLQDGLWSRTDDPVDGPALLDEQDRRDRPDAVPARKPGVLVDVDLHQRDPAFRGLGQLLEDRRDRPARPAPLRPEVHHHETLVRDQGLVEVLLSRADRLGYSVIPASIHRGAPSCSLGRRSEPSGFLVQCIRMNDMYLHTKSLPGKAVAGSMTPWIDGTPD